LNLAHLLGDNFRDDENNLVKSTIILAKTVIGAGKTLLPIIKSHGGEDGRGGGVSFARFHIVKISEHLGSSVEDHGMR